MDITKIEEDYKKVTEIDETRSVLKDQKAEIMKNYTTLNEEMIKQAAIPTYLSAEALSKQLKRGLKVLGVIKINYNAAKNGTYDYEKTPMFRLQNGEIFSVGCRSPWSYSRYVETLVKHGHKITEEIKNKDMKDSYSEFLEYITSHQRELLSAKGDRYGSSDEIKEPPYVIPGGSKKVYVMDEYNSRYGYGGNVDSRIKCLDVVGVSVETTYSDTHLKIHTIQNGITSTKFYDHVVQQLKPELEEMFKTREIKRENDCKFEMELTRKIDEYFKKWIVLMEI